MLKRGGFFRAILLIVVCGDWCFSNQEPHPKSVPQPFLIILFAFGKDEVGGPNLPSSSKKPPFSVKSGGFSYLFLLNGVAQNVGQPLKPHRDPRGEMCRNEFSIVDKALSSVLSSSRGCSYV